MIKRKNVLLFLILSTIILISPVINANNWEIVDYSNPDTISDSGLTIAEFNSLTQKEWLNIIGNSKKLSFAYQAKNANGDDITKEVEPNVIIKLIGSNKEQNVLFPKSDYKNKKPQFTNLNNQSILESEKFSYQITAEDPNEDKIVFELLNDEELPNDLTMNQGLIIWETNYQDEGVYEIFIQASDGKSTNKSYFILTVNHKNAPPELKELPKQKVNENELLEFQIPAIDIDEDILTFSSSNLPEGATLSGEGLFRWVPTHIDSGTYTFNIKLNDGTVINNKDYTVEVVDKNAPPELEKISNQTINENELFSYQIIANDVDGDNLSYSIVNRNELPIDISVDNSGLIRYQSNYESNGKYNVLIEVSDGHFTENTTFELNVKDLLNPHKQIKINNSLLNFDKVVYVDSNIGNDSTGVGTINKPYCTIKRALKDLDKDNQAIFINGGVYNEEFTNRSASYDSREYSLFSTAPNVDYSVIGDRENPPIIKNKNADYNQRPISNMFLSLKTKEATKALNIEFYNLIFESEALFSDISNDFNHSISFNNCVYNSQNIYAFYFNVGYASTTNYEIELNNFLFIGDYLNYTNSNNSSLTANNSVFYYNHKNKYKYSPSLNLNSSLINPSFNYDSDYYFSTDNWKEQGIGQNPDGTQANLGIYGGPYSW